MRATAALAAGAVLVLPLLVGCEEAKSGAHEVYVPASVQEVDGGKAKRITYTERGATAVGLTLATVGRLGPHLVIPHAALIYDGQGVPHVYVRLTGLTFQKARVEVVRVEGDRVLLSSGPAPGTRVVTTGSAELFGTELGIEGKH